MFSQLRRRREAKRLDRILPNPRSASPKGTLSPYKRDSYGKSVLVAARDELLILAAIFALGFAIYPLIMPAE